MKAIILAAGFATRLYPLTKNISKPLLKINKRPIIDYIVEKIFQISEIDEIIVITNNKFYENFLEWQKEKKNIKILNDSVNSENEKLGAVGDLALILEKEKINQDILVISGDNFFKESLEQPYEIFKKQDKDLSIFYNVEGLNEAKRFGIALVKDNIITDFEEKPENPKSTLCSASTYFFKKETLELIKKFNQENKNSDQPGKLLEWLYKQKPIYVYIVDKWTDIGTIESYKKAVLEENDNVTTEF